jgi:hypothetical protein
MGEYAAPYNVLQEGFTTLLAKPSGVSSSFQQVYDLAYSETNGGKLTTVDSSGSAVSFLQNAVQSEKDTLDALIKTAKTMQPIAQKAFIRPDAYDSAFESDIKKPLPGAGATLQGFAVLLLFISYLVLTLVSTIATNYSTQSASKAGYVFLGFTIVGAILYSFLIRLG